MRADQHAVVDEINDAARLRALLAECERAIAIIRETIPMTLRSEEVWQSLHQRVRATLDMPLQR